MAVITLKQLLHRPSPGAAVSSSDPLEVILYDANGNPISRTNPLVIAGDDGSAEKAIKVDSDGRPEVTLSGSRRQIGRVVQNVALDVAPGGNHLITVTPPAGEIRRLLKLTFAVGSPPGASTGSHQVRVRVGANSDDHDTVLAVASPYDKGLEFLRNVGSTDGTVLPADASEQQRAILHTMYASNAPLYLLYNNNTDAAQTNTLKYSLLWEAEAVTW